MKKNLLFFCCLLVLSCTKKTHQNSSSYETISTNELQFDIVVPEFLWSKILDEAPPTINKKMGAYEIFFPLQTFVQIGESRGNALGGKNIRYEYGVFGGEIDWNILLEKNSGGSMNVFFQLKEVEELDNLRVYFLSWTQKDIFGNEIFGNGCSRLLDITSFFKKEILESGLSLHTKDMRYLYATLGRFYFIYYSKEKIYFSQVSFSHSDKMKDDFVCEDRI